MPNRLRRVSVRRPARPSSISSRTQTTCPEHRTTWQHGTRPRSPKRQSRNAASGRTRQKRKKRRPPPGTPEQMGFDLQEGPEPLRYVGELFRTYILAERGDEVCIIDKHAAHERQLFEKLAASYGDVPSQRCWNRWWWSFRPRRRRHCWPTSTCWNVPGWRSTTLAEIRSFCARSLPMWSRAAPKTFSWSWRRSWPTAAATP